MKTHKGLLPKFVRQWMAGYLARRADEWGGALHDYKNGKWKLIALWSDQKGQNDAVSLIGNMMDRAADDIYIATIMVGECRGYFVVHDSNRQWWTRWFWSNIYSPQEAYMDVVKRCRETADKMGYRRPE
jgi:hypothetical protein